MKLLGGLLRAITPTSMHRSERLRSRVFKAADDGILSGPFKDMRYIGRSHGSVFLPKVLGTYEREIASYFENFDRHAFPHVVVAGAAEGYYAVGLARSSSVRRVVAFEPDPAARESLAHLASLNGVADKLQQHGMCDCSSLALALSQPEQTFLLVDIEGGEGILLDPIVVPALQHTTMFVEIHEFAIPGLEAVLRARFKASHQIGRFDAVTRTLNDFPVTAIGELPSSLRGSALQAMNEHRPPGMFWLLFEPMARASSVRGVLAK